MNVGGGTHLHYTIYNLQLMLDYSKNALDWTCRTFYSSTSPVVTLSMSNVTVTESALSYSSAASSFSIDANLEYK